MKDSIAQYLEIINELQALTVKYLEGDCAKASVAKNMRAVSVELGKASADMRKATVAHHKKPKEI